jgi:exodeoxyribonuclease V alpha subunit
MFKVEYAAGFKPEDKERIIQERARRETLNQLSELDRAVYIARETLDAARLAGDTVISATIAEITHRNDSGWLRANIDSNGFAAISGIPYNAIKLEKGMKIEVTGIEEVWRDRKQLRFTPSGILICERSYCEDPFMRAVNRACKSFTVTRLQTLKTALGDEWIKLILNDPWIEKRNEAERSLIKEHGSKWRQLATVKELEVFYKWPELLNHAAFQHWPIETKQGTVAVAEALNGLTSVKLDMLKINYPVIHNRVINKVQVTEPIDAMVFVRQRKISFAQADDLNKLEGDNFKPSIPRVIGAVWDALASSEDDGNSALPVAEIIERARLQYGCPITDISVGINQAKTICEIKTQGDFNHALITVGSGDAESLAFAENVRTEAGILRHVKERMTDKHSVEYIPDTKLKFDDTQNKAVQMALNNGISIITGGPGTGKTTICFEIAETLNSKNILGLAIAARAARNLTDKTGIESMTIARYIALAINGSLPIANTLIIDEASMVGSKSMSQILYCAAEAETKRVILVGDKDQLPPINWGCPFADLIEANQLAIARLETNHRVGAGSGIAVLASDIRNKRPLQPYYDDVVFSNVAEDRIADKVLSEYAALIKRGMKPSDIGLITPYTKKQYGYSTDKLNDKIRGILFPKQALNKPYVGDLIIGTKNHRKSKDRNGLNMKREHEFMNGQRGVIGTTTQILAIQFDGNNDTEYFEPSELELNGLPKHVAYGYATTIHKSQGGEYQHVIAVVPKNLAFTFGKPGLYTAVTRAKQTLTIMGALDELPNIIEREDARRCTALKSLLGLPLFNPPELKSELKPDLKPRLKAGKIVDLAARFKAIADMMASGGLDLPEDDLGPIDRG